jgi:hypothetical protein
MPKKTERLGILSLHERELIQEVDRIRSGEIKNSGRAPSRLAELLPDLDRRLTAVAVDLGIILESKALRTFLASRAKYLDPILNKYHTINQVNFGHDYSTWRVRSIKKPIPTKRGIKVWKNPKKKPRQEFERQRSYWLDISESNKPDGLTLLNTLSPEHAIRGIEGYWLKGGVNIRDILSEAVRLEKEYETYISRTPSARILPRTEELAINIKQVKREIDRFNANIPKREVEELHNIPPLALKEVAGITDPHEREKKLEELANRYDPAKKK